jgi:hypothetical protein
MKLRDVILGHVVVAAAMAAGAVSAQVPGPRGSDPQQRIEQLATLLDLDAGQKLAVQSVLEEQRARMETLREQDVAAGQRPTPQQLLERREQLQSETMEKLRGVLSQQQLKKFAALPPPPGPGARAPFQRPGVAQ